MGLMSVSEAQNIILETIVPSSCREKVPLDQSIGRFLADDLVASFDQPPFTNSAMDGYATQSIYTQNATPETPVTLPVLFLQQAGSPFTRMPMGASCEITTGAPLPEGADAVIPKEDVVLGDNRIEIRTPLSPNENIRHRGEDLLQGSLLLKRGAGIEHRHLGLLASFGISQAPVIAKPRVALISTGDEIVEIDEQRRPHQIFNSNRWALSSLLTYEGAEVTYLGTCRDDSQSLENLLSQGLKAQHDFLILTGGVSVGPLDLAVETSKRCGFEMLFHKVAVKPGKPLLFARSGQTYLFGLPGNPVSTQVCFYQFVYPALRRFVLAHDDFLKKEKAFLTKATRQGNRHEFLRGTFEIRDGQIFATPLTRQGSGSVDSFAMGNCFISVPIGKSILPEGALVEMQRYE